MKRFLQKILHNKVAKNASWLIGGKIAQMIISLIVGLLTARYLGPANYGLINYVGAYTAFFNSFCTLGINSILVKEILDHPDEEGKVMGTSLFLRAISSFLSAITIVCIVGIIDADEPTTIIVAVFCSLGVVFHVFECFNFWFQAKLASKITAIATLAAYCVTAGYRVILMLTGRKVTLFALATSVDYIVIAVILLIAYAKHGGPQLSFSWRYGKELLGKSYHFILSGLMVAVYGHTDKLMLKQMINETEIGYYSTALSLCNMWTFVLSAIVTSMVPSIIEAHKKNQLLFEQRNKQLYAIVFYISATVSIAFTLAAPLIIQLLYGKAYMPAATPLRIITWYTAFSYLGVARDTWVICEDCQKYLKYLYMAAAGGNIILNLIFIPLWGASGAALASLLTQIMTIILPIFIKKMRTNTVWILEAILLKGVISPQNKGH